MSLVVCFKLWLWYAYVVYAMLVAGLEGLGAFKTIRFLVIFVPIFILGKFMLFLDNILFRGYRNVKIVKPVFILGHPRSGTTFTHRLFTQTHEWAAWKTWELLVPSIIGRYVVGPILNLCVAILSRSWHKADNISDDAHEVKLDTYEEEEVLFFWSMNTHFFHVFTPLAFSKRFRHLMGYETMQPDWQQKYDCKLLRELLQRQVYYTGKQQVVAKLPYSTLRVRHLMEEFPDAKIVYIARPPTETLPSILSLTTSFHVNQFGTNIPKNGWEAFYTNYAEKSAELQQYFIDFTKNGCPENVKVIKYWDLRQNLLPMFQEICEFCGLTPSEELTERVRVQHEKQATYVRKHKVKSLADFGLTWDKLMPEFEPIFDFYGFEKPQVSK